MSKINVKFLTDEALATIKANLDKFTKIVKENPSDSGSFIAEIIFRKREYQEYITPQNFGSGVFFCVNYDKINIIIKRKQV